MNPVKPTKDQRIGIILRHERRHRHLSLCEVADPIGISIVTLSEIERGVTPAYPYREGFEKVLGVTVAEDGMCYCDTA